MGTQVVRRYIHLSGKDIDTALLGLAEGVNAKPDEYKLKSLKCKRCSESISPTMNFCSKCALPVNINDEYTREMELENENRELREKLDQGIKTIREEMKLEMRNEIAQLMARLKPEIIREGLMP
jgi:predicted amidophosphoribosyltransferase